jgi:hypothetical protein
MDASTDVSKIIGLIMENPDIIERIKSLSNKETESKEPSTKSDEVTQEAVLEKESKESVATYAKEQRHDKRKRSELLCALKPYLSESRSKAIDTMLNIFEVIDLMKAR